MPPTIPINHYFSSRNQQNRTEVLSYYSMLMYSRRAPAWNILISSRPRKSFAKCSPNLPKIDQRSSQKAFWNPFWTHIWKKIHFECPQNGQDAPGSAPKRLQTVPSPPQIEPQIFSNPIFGWFSSTYYHIFNSLGFSINFRQFLINFWHPDL